MDDNRDNTAACRQNDRKSKVGSKAERVNASNCGVRSEGEAVNEGKKPVESHLQLGFSPKKEGNIRPNLRQPALVRVYSFGAGRNLTNTS